MENAEQNLAPRTQYQGIQLKALKLLGSGVPAENVALALGVTPSYISQLLSDEEFALQLVELRYNAMQKHNQRDANYDEIEDRLLKQLETVLPLMMKPMEIIRSLQIINGAKRRGASSPESLTNKQTQVTLIMPTKILQVFSADINNQVVEVSGQELVTIDAKSLLSKVGKSDDSSTQKAIGSSTTTSS